MTSQRENRPYVECGLRNVTLQAIEVRRCRPCGHYRLVIPEADTLHRLIAELLIHKMTRLSGPEIRFLRRCLGLNLGELACRMGVAIETISRWEHETDPIGLQADRLLRLIVVQAIGCHYPLEMLDRIGTAKTGEAVLQVAQEGGGWVVTA